MAVLQQIITDAINGTPASSLIRDYGNSGLLVKYASDQSDRNRSAYGCPVFELTRALSVPSVATDYFIQDKPKGVLGDYHSSRQISIIRKGRVKVRTSGPAYDESNIGKKGYAYPGGLIGPPLPATAGNTNGTDHAGSDPANAFGEIVGLESITDILGNIRYYYIVDINFPEN